jgi:hypothetical protein
LILHNLKVEGSSFCKLTVKETVDGERATVAWFGQYWAMVRAASDEASIPVTALVVAAAMGGRPPSNNSVRGVLVRWVHAASSSGNDG